MNTGSGFFNKALITHRVRKQQRERYTFLLKNGFHYHAWGYSIHNAYYTRLSKRFDFEDIHMVLKDGLPIPLLFDSKSNEWVFYKDHPYFKRKQHKTKKQP